MIPGAFPSALGHPGVPPPGQSWEEAMLYQHREVGAECQGTGPGRVTG